MANECETGMGPRTDGEVTGKIYRNQGRRNTVEPAVRRRARRDRAHFARTLLLRVLETKIKRLGSVEARSHPGRLHGRTILKYYTSCTAYTVTYRRGVGGRNQVVVSTYNKVIDTCCRSCGPAAGMRGFTRASRHHTHRVFPFFSIEYRYVWSFKTLNSTVSIHTVTSAVRIV